MQSARCFIALPLNPEQQRSLRALLVSVPLTGVRLIPAQNYHLTLAFLGNCPARQLVLLRRRLGVVAAPAFTLDFLEIGPFPGPRGPVIAALPEANPASLIALQQQIGAALADTGMAAEKRIFRPHVSLGRRHHSRPLGPTACTWQLSVSTFELVRSELTPAGSRYHCLARFALQ